MRKFFALALALCTACSDGVLQPSDSVASVSAAAIVASAGSSVVAPEAATDFESFTVGGINGQWDWKSFGGAGATAPGSHCAVYDHVIHANDAFAGAAFGARSLRISNAVTTGCYGDQTFSARSADVAGQAGATSLSRDGLVDFALPAATRRNHFEAEWTVRSATPGEAQPGLEVVVSPARGDDHRMSWVRMADLPDGLAISAAARADQSNPGAFQVVTIATGLDRSQSHTIRLTIDFVDGSANDVVQVFVNGALHYVGQSWETYYALDPNGAANFGGNTPAVNRLMFRTGSDLLRGLPGTPAPALLGKGFLFDGVRVRAFSVPKSGGDCQQGGWQSLFDTNGGAFKNQGDCVSWANASSR